MSEAEQRIKKTFYDTLEAELKASEVVIPEEQWDAVIESTKTALDQATTAIREELLNARIDELNSLANELTLHTDQNLQPIKDRIEQLKSKKEGKREQPHS